MKMSSLNCNILSPLFVYVKNAVDRRWLWHKNSKKVHYNINALEKETLINNLLTTYEKNQTLKVGVFPLILMPFSASDCLVLFFLSFPLNTLHTITMQTTNICKVSRTITNCSLLFACPCQRCVVLFTLFI